MDKNKGNKSKKNSIDSQIDSSSSSNKNSKLDSEQNSSNIKSELDNEQSSSNIKSELDNEQNSSDNKSEIDSEQIKSDKPSDYSVLSDSDANTNETNNASSSSSQLDLAVLNEVSKIAKMGMDSISYLSPKVTDKELRKELVAIYSQYGNIQSQINQHFEKYGEIPDSTPLKDKMMSFCGVQFNTLKDKSNSHIAEIMIQGTLMGVIKCQKILNCQLDIQKSTIELLKEFNKFQRENIDKFNAYL